MHAFKVMQLLGDFWSAHAQHEREKIVDKRKVVAVETVVAHQQPPGESAWMV